jgi:hypothetical protein
MRPTTGERQVIRSNCQHTEGGEKKNGDKVDRHDCAYVDARNSLINRAAIVARARLLRDQGNMLGFDAAFLDEMKRLALETGIQSQPTRLLM